MGAFLNKIRKISTKDSCFFNYFSYFCKINNTN